LNGSIEVIQEKAQPIGIVFREAKRKGLLRSVIAKHDHSMESLQIQPRKLDALPEGPSHNLRVDFQRVLFGLAVQAWIANSFRINNCWRYAERSGFFGEAIGNDQRNDQ
jgi:hypothetical protein